MDDNTKAIVASNLAAAIYTTRYSGESGAITGKGIIKVVDSSTQSIALFNEVLAALEKNQSKTSKNKQPVVDAVTDTAKKQKKVG